MLETGSGQLDRRSGVLFNLGKNGSWSRLYLPDERYSVLSTGPALG
jgi:hypothetical protein